ncbi:hypothetical protein XH93_13600 [Bradyrhizobium sp. CCBAU 51753]|nr:hypothetical protein XH93_13600 [Bradyrhizobium sp. CCBAU 51753]
MVWGMYLPRSGGRYGPYGNEEGPVDQYGDGWRHRLIKYYQDQMPDAQKSFYRDASKYAYSVVEKFLYEPGHRQPGPDDLMVTPIEVHEPPRFFQTDKGYNELASVISLSNRMWAVDAAVKKIVEQFEPDLHRFYPVEIRSPRGMVYPVQYYLLVVGSWLQGFSPEDSNQESFTPHEANGVRWCSILGYKNNVAGLALRPSVFNGAHLWRERGLNEWLLCLSDMLEAELAGAGLMLPKYYRMRSV